MKNGKIESEVLNLTDEMVSNLISKVEGSIFDLTATMEQKLVPLKEAEELYMPLKIEYDQLSGSLEKEKQTLSALIGYRDNKNERKNIRVYKSISNANMKRARGKRTFPFTKGAVEVLKEEQKFLSFATLTFKVFEKFPEWKILFQGGKEKSAKAKVANNFRSIAVNYAGVRNPKLILQGEKIGLPEWLDESGNPLPKYLKSLMAAV